MRPGNIFRATCVPNSYRLDETKRNQNNTEQGQNIRYEYIFIHILLMITFQNLWFALWFINSLNDISCWLAQKLHRFQCKAFLSSCMNSHFETSFLYCYFKIENSKTTSIGVGMLNFPKSYRCQCHHINGIFMLTDGSFTKNVFLQDCIGILVWSS